jgi:hypothetical protein
MLGFAGRRFLAGCVRLQPRALTDELGSLIVPYGLLSGFETSKAIRQLVGFEFAPLAAMVVGQS